MERRTKLAGGYLALCCVFMVFMSVSSVKFYNPDLFIEEITKLLKELQHNLTDMEAGDYKVNGISWYDMEHGDHCPGTILKIFQKGTKKILDLNVSPSVENITNAIDNCVTKLWEECTSLQENEPNCKYSTKNEKVINFVETFGEFLRSLRTWHTCGNKFNQEYDLSEEHRPDENIPICGKY